MFNSIILILFYSFLFCHVKNLKLDSFYSFLFLHVKNFKLDSFYSFLFSYVKNFKLDSFYSFLFWRVKNLNLFYLNEILGKYFNDLNDNIICDIFLISELDTYHFSYQIMLSNITCLYCSILCFFLLNIFNNSYYFSYFVHFFQSYLT